MGVDLRKEHECRIELHKHLKNNEILYGEISPNLLITISDFLLEWEGKNANTSERQSNIPVVSQRSELFFAFLKWAKQADLDYPDEMLLKDFEQFNAKNCG